MLIFLREEKQASNAQIEPVEDRIADEENADQDEPSDVEVERIVHDCAS